MEEDILAYLDRKTGGKLSDRIRGVAEALVEPKIAEAEDLIAEGLADSEAILAEIAAGFAADIAKREAEHAADIAMVQAMVDEMKAEIRGFDVETEAAAMADKKVAALTAENESLKAAAVRRLREKGDAPDEIARALGLGPAEVARLLAP